jgi:hypothetical protein
MILKTNGDCNDDFFGVERSVAESGEEGSGERRSGTRLLLPLAANGFGGGLLHLGFHRFTLMGTRRRWRSSPAGRGLLPQGSRQLLVSRRFARPRWVWSPLLLWCS